MAKRDIRVEYEFVSSRADGDSYTHIITIRAHNEHAALAVAHIFGFNHFGAKFNDNCIDWRIAR